MRKLLIKSHMTAKQGTLGAFRKGREGQDEPLFDEKKLQLIAPR